LSQVQQTSLDVYYQKVLPNLMRRQREVLRVFIDNPYRDFTNMEVAAMLGFSINRITPRVLELRNKGLLVKYCRRRCAVTGNMAYAWRLA